MLLPTESQLSAARNSLRGGDKVPNESDAALAHRLSTWSGQPESLRKILRDIHNDQNPAWAKSDFQREFWNCAEPYLALDTDHDGVADWTIVGDGELSPTLIPSDPDLDNDGIENLLDPEPTIANAKAWHGKGVPPHLLAKEPKARIYQRILFDKYGWVAVDSSDNHSPAVLEALLFMLDMGLPREFTRKLKDLRAIYAFYGHDEIVNQAGYHRQMKALSVGGRVSYDTKLSAPRRYALLKTLSHEIGHAALFDFVGPEELKDFASQQQGWSPVFKGSMASDLLNPSFFTPFPGKDADFVSEYSRSNLHEWFAEAFSALVMKRLVLSGRVQESPLKKFQFQRLPLVVENWVDRRCFKTL